MYLKSLKLTGFKSFADRTRLEFRPGVTVVVGPNGSGKSNLVDALSWVLGTQSAKSLRTPKMEDVIFAGTASRPALGRAEVSLVIDNADRLIDLDLDEVAITRRLYRDGSSDYELNGVSCRLLDIQDLLSDSGVGRQQHVIIGQGEIGHVLNATPAEHRSVIEEAAGILKHRRRRERAVRRLERTDEDLLRLNDIVTEITRQMRPLRRQARAAERYDGVKADVIALRLYLGGRALTGYDTEMRALEAERSDLSTSLMADETRIDELGSDLSALTEQASRVAQELDRDTAAAAMLETSSERLRRIASVAHERQRAASGRVEAASERLGDLRSEAEDIGRELAELAAQRSLLEASVTETELRMTGLEDLERELASQAAMSPEGAEAAVRGQLTGVEATLNRDRREIEAIDHRVEVLRSQVEAESVAIDGINDEITELDASLSKLQTRYERAEAERQTAQDRWTQAEEALAAAKIEVASMRARVDAIASALDGRHDPESRQIVEAAPGALGSLVSQLDVPAGWEAAVGAALGQWVDSVSFHDPESMRDAMRSVKASGGGEVSIVAPVADCPVLAREVAAKVGLDALVDLLGPGVNRSLAEALLGDVVVAQGWSAGWEVVSTNPGVRVVTSDGDLIAREGARISNPDGAAPVMLDAAEVALERAETEMARAVSIHNAARRDFEASREAERIALEDLEAAEATLAGRSEAMARIGQSVAGLRAEMERLQVRMKALFEAVETGERDAVGLRERIESLHGEGEEMQRAWRDLEARLVQAGADREMARASWQEATGRLRSLVERQLLLEDRARRIAAEIDRIGIEPRGKVDVTALARVEEMASRALKVLEAGLSVLRDRQADLRTANQEARHRLSAARDEHEARREATTHARGRIAQIDLRATELRLHREAVMESIRRDAGSGPEAAYQAQRPDYPEDADLEEMLASKLAELERMGPINPLAAAEFRDLDERHGFLEGQMADIEESRSELRKVIAALDREINERFQEAFTEVASAFEKYFGLLFPGGRGRIRLVDPEDEESGVSIEAQPMGKKLSHMSLLSGGERSLAALAFLFSIFEARPSPFYVLDEVEAALDDVNLRRFLRMVDEFRSRAQLIIVTHQQQTMEAADVLYGITLQPGGSSQAVRKELAAAVAVVEG